MDLTPTTALEAVNTMLSAIAEAPVSSLEDTGSLDVVNALAILTEESRRFQKRGWWFNTDVDFTLARTVPDNFVLVPSDALKVTPSGANVGQNIVQRGTKLWDKDSNTFAFTASVVATIVRFFDFEDLPETARDYITVCACLAFIKRQDRSAEQVSFSKEDVRDAWVEVIREDVANANNTFFSGNFVQSIVTR